MSFVCPGCKVRWFGGITNNCCGASRCRPCSEAHRCGEPDAPGPASWWRRLVAKLSGNIAAQCWRCPACAWNHVVGARFMIYAPPLPRYCKAVHAEPPSGQAHFHFECARCGFDHVQLAPRLAFEWTPGLRPDGVIVPVRLDPGPGGWPPIPWPLPPAPPPPHRPEAARGYQPEGGPRNPVPADGAGSAVQPPPARRVEVTVDREAFLRPERGVTPCGKRYTYNNGSANAMSGAHNHADRCRLPKGHAGDHGQPAPERVGA